MNRVLSIIVSSLILFSCTTEKTSNDQATPSSGVRVKTDKIEATSTSITLNYSGLLEPATTVPLSFQLPGTISRVMVDEGDPVRQGQVLASIDKTSYQSSYNAALALQQQAQDAFDRLQKVYENGSLPEIKWEEVKSKLEQANAALAIAKRNLSNCEIKSPINGLVGERFIEVGATATPGLTALQVFSARELDARISAPGNEINKISKGQIATVTVPTLNETNYTATADKIAVSAHPVSKTFEVKFKIENPGNELKPGMICNVDVRIDSEQTPVLVPIQSVMTDSQGNQYIYLIDAATQKAKKQIVSTSGIINNKLAVTSGVKPGDQYVIEGQQKLIDNATVILN